VEVGKRRGRWKRAMKHCDARVVCVLNVHTRQNINRGPAAVGCICTLCSSKHLMFTADASWPC
jgi:hypothetical protein